ncbi:hypothetical protein [Mycoplasmopsis verecunda]|uniref:Uncharacterized protein n=1 Tax=Mycoplasmopsis verecunda TaxID=171291 RepID=A0A1T4M412_9BACT|nr:hypothetical protein [Mycoplasmopsis verecunda]WPB54730.1 hypothetical protein SAM46_01060 [Mycoplasmopsis verecunda]SJZ61693.1 hypothetical protein SAMN02745154_00621 [Mycoplasmopsis verecunda]
MREILEFLNKKVQKDKKKLKLYKLLDDMFSLLIAILNISAIVLASIALSILSKEKPNNVQNTGLNSYWNIVILATFIILSFFLNLFIAVYRYNTHSTLYKKIYNTISYLQIKYNAGQISSETMEQILDALWKQATTRKKIVIGAVLKSELTNSGK